MNTIGERIKSLRTGKGLSSQELGDIVGRSKSNISGYETGKYEPSAQTIISICKYFDVSSDWLLTGMQVQKTEHCDGQPLSEAEADLVAMYRFLSAEDRKTIFDLTTLKYEQATGERGSVYLTYIDTKEQQENDPVSGIKPTRGIV